MNRKTTKAEPVTPESSTRDVAIPGTLAADQLAQIEQAMHAEQLQFTLQLGAWAGRDQMAKATQKISDVSRLIEIGRFKESKKYKGLRHFVDGKVVSVTTFSEFCGVVLGLSVEKVDEDLRNLKALGPEMLDGLQQMGIGYRNLREMRHLPPADLALISEAAKTGSVDKVKEAAEDAIERLRLEREQVEDKLAQERDERNRDRAVTNRRYAEKHAELEAVKDEIARRDLATPDEREAANMSALLSATLAADQAILRLLYVAGTAMDEATSEARSLAAQQSVNYIAQRLVDGAEERRICFDLADRMEPLPIAEFRAQIEAEARAAGGTPGGSEVANELTK